MNPDLFRASYRRVNVRGGKVYIPVLIFMNIHQRTLRGVATEASKRSERFMRTWKRWHGIWQSMPVREVVKA